MSLHRVQSVEAWERPSRASSPAAVERRKMSFNPVTDWVPPKAAEREPISAIEVPKAKRILQVVIACIYCLLAAGVVFGYAALKPVLIKEGVYREYCTQDDTGGEDETCYGQEIRLNLMFTTAAVATNVCALPVGTILDRYGPRVCGIVGSILIALGSVFLTISPNVPFDGYIPGYLFLALGGPFVFISSFQLSNCFPRRSGLILALLTGAFDTSSAIFLVYRLLYSATDGWLIPQRFFSFYLIVPIFIFLVQATIMPSTSYKTVGELVKAAEESPDITIPEEVNANERARDDFLREERRIRRESVMSELTPLLGQKGEDEAKKEEEQKKQSSGVWGVLHGKSALQQIKTPWFILMTTFVLVQMTRINYFVATIRSQYVYLFGELPAADHVNHIFDVALPAGGVISIPFIGMILDNLSTTLTLGLLVGTATLIGVLGVLPFMWAAYTNIALFVLYRPFYYTAVSDYAAKVFGFQTFGKVYGMIICVSGLFNFSQSVLDALTHKTFRDDPVPVNLVLLALVLVVGTTLTLYVYRKSVLLVGDWREEEAEGESERLIPNGFDGDGRQNGSIPNGNGWSREESV